MKYISNLATGRHPGYRGGFVCGIFERPFMKAYDFALFFIELCMHVPALTYRSLCLEAWCEADMASCACMYACVFVFFVDLHELNICSVTQVYQTCPNRPPTAQRGTQRSAQPTKKERERERVRSLKKTKADGKKRRKKMQITEKAPFVCWIKADQLKWNIHQNRHSWWGAGDGAGEERGVCSPGAEGVRGGRGWVIGRVWPTDESQPGLGHLHIVRHWVCMEQLTPIQMLCQHSDSTEETGLYRSLHHKHLSTTQKEGILYCWGQKLLL